MTQVILKNLLGRALMILGAALFKGAALNYQLLSPYLGSATRVIANLAVVLVLYAMLTPVGSLRSLWGREKAYLCLWGLLGSLTNIFYYQSLEVVGVGVASFLLTTNGSMLVLLSAFQGKSRPSPLSFLVATLCLVGSFFLTPGSFGSLQWHGLVFGLLAAFCAACAYLLVGRNLIEESTLTIMFYWSGIGAVTHLLQIPFVDSGFDSSANLWAILLFGGILASIGQFWVTKSFQVKGNWVIGIVSYTSCLFGLILDYGFLGVHLSAVQLSGALIIVGANGLFLFAQSPSQPLGTRTKALRHK